MNAFEQYKKDVQMGIWITKDNIRVHVSDMPTYHIKNCIKMIKRLNGTWRHEYLIIFERELRKRRWEDPTYDTYFVLDSIGCVVRSFPTYKTANEFLFSRGNPSRWRIEQRYNID